MIWEFLTRNLKVRDIRKFEWVIQYFWILGAKALMSHLQIEFCKVDCTKWFQILIYIFKIYELKFRDLKSFIYMVWESLKVEYEVANTWIERCGVERTVYVILASTFATWLADSNTILQIMFWTEQQILSRFVALW